MRKRIIFLTVLLTCNYVLHSCKEKKQITYDDNSVLHLNLRAVSNEKEKDFYLSGLTDDIKYIPLETSEASLLYSINSLYLNANSVFVSDTKKLLQFDISGKFIRQIGNTGKGPGEYGTFIRFTINPSNKEIYIYCRNTSKIIVYDLITGKFIRAFTVDFEVSRFDVTTQGNVVFFTADLPTAILIHTINEIVVTDGNGNLVDSIPNFNRLINKPMPGYSSVYKVNSEEIRYIYNFKDTLYTLTLNKDLIRRPHVIFNLENKIQPEMITPDPANNNIQYPDFLSIPRILEHNEFIFITLQNGIGFGKWDFTTILYNTKSKELIPTAGFINDIDGGLPFWPRFSNENTLINFYEADHIIEHFRSNPGNSVYSESFMRLVKRLKPEDNPVLVILK